MTFIKIGVIGHPIHHSKSPLIHNYWIEKYGLSGSYEAIDIPPKDLKSRLPQLLKEEGYSGFNLTIPHKEIAMNICDSIDPIAQKIGAVNTVKLLPDGQIFGTNTDAYGFMENIRSAYPDYDFAHGTAVILGAGGAAKAVLYGLLDAGIPHVIITNRTLEKAEHLAAHDSRVTAVPWDDRHQALDGAHLLVNTTALGMDKQPALDLDLCALPTTALVTDIVYAPLMTDLLTHAQDRGNAIVTGIGMLLHQARPAFEHWYGTLPAVTSELEDLVL